MEVTVSAFAVVTAVACSMLVGAVWYSPSVFGKKWARLAGIDTGDDGGSVLKPLAVSLVVSLITAYVLAYFSFLTNMYFGHSFFQDAMTTGLIAWLGFTATRFVTHDAFEGRPFKLTLLNIANDFTTIMVMALVIGIFGR